MLPVVHMEDNLVLDVHGRAYAVYTIGSQPYAFQPKTICFSIIDRVIRGLSALEGEFWIYLLTQQWTSEQVLREMNQRSQHTIWKHHQAEVKEYLNYNLPFRRKNLIAIPLGKEKISIDLTSDNWQGWFRQAWSGVLHVKNRFLMGQDLISQERINALKKEAHDWLIKLNPMTRVKKATLREIEWWLKKSYYRGLADPKLELPQPLPVQAITLGGKEWLRPVRAPYISLSQVKGQEKPQYLVFDHPDGEKSFQTFFSTVSVPQPIPEEDPTGYEWLYGVLEQTTYPVDAAIHLRIEAANKAIQNLKKKKKTAEAQYKEWDENNEDIPLELEEDMDAVTVLEKKLRARQPLIHSKVIFGLGADAYEELKSRIEDFKQQAGKYHVLVRAPGDMKKMFQSFYPFLDDLPQTWETPLDPGVLGAAVPFGSKSVGDPSGLWLGRLSNERPVWMNPKRPAQELNSPPAIMIVGTLGSGKSVLLKYIVVLLLAWGAKGFLIDPKGDSERMADLPFNTKILKFTPGSDTKFSPFRIGNTQDARAVMEILFNPRNNEIRKIVLGTAVDKVLKGNKWDMFEFQRAILEIGEHHPDEQYKKEARIVSELVKLMENHELGAMFMGEDSNINLFDHDLVIAITRGLTLPDRSKKREEWSENEQISVAVMYAVASLGISQLRSLPTNILKVLGLDEIWVLFLFELGRKLVNEALRYSRSENVIPLLASQNATDFEGKTKEDEDFTGMFAWKFMLHLESPKQVEAALRILGMTGIKSERWVKKFADYSNGAGLVRDPEGRIGEIQIDVLPEGLMEYFSSTPSS